MSLHPLRPFFLLFLLVAAIGVQQTTALRVLIGNDDSWGTANIRAMYMAAKAAGHDVVLAAPAKQQSGTDGLQRPPTTLLTEGAFGLVKAGAPAVGHDADDNHVWYINSTPASSIAYGIEHLAERYFGGPPDLILTGPNQGPNIGLAYLGSGTYGAAKYAVQQGIAAIAVSAADETERPYTELGVGAEEQANAYAHMALDLVHELEAKRRDSQPLLPNGVGLNVNVPKTGPGGCQPNISEWVVTRILGSLDADPDACACGQRPSERCKLPTEEQVATTGRPCLHSISVFEPRLAPDAPPWQQKLVIDKLQNFTTCL